MASRRFSLEAWREAHERVSLSLLSLLPHRTQTMVEPINETETAAIRAQLISHESVVLHAYKDSRGILTIGIGRNIDPDAGGGISQDEADYMFNNDLKNKIADLDKRLPWWRNLSPIRRRVLIDMCFQMGIRKLLTFVNTLGAIQNGDYVGGARMMLESDWARLQTPNRARRLAKMMEFDKEFPYDTNR